MQVDGGIRSALRESVSDPRHVCPTSDQLSSRVEELTAKLQTVNETLDEERASGREKDTEIETLKGMLAKEKQRVKRHWRERCEQLMAHEEALEEKDVEIMSLKGRILSLNNARPVEEVSAEQAEQPSHTTDSPLQGLTTLSSHEVPETTSIARRGKAPPVEPYTGEICCGKNGSLCLSELPAGMAGQSKRNFYN